MSARPPSASVGPSPDRPRRLGLREILRLARRTLRYLWPALRELRPALALVPLVGLAIPVALLLTDLVLNRMLAGNPLTPFEATVLRLPAGDFVEVEALGTDARSLLRTRLALGTAALVLLMTPVVIWAYSLFVAAQQRVNQLLRVQMVENLQAQSLRFHQASRVGDAVYRVYQDSAMVTNVLALLVRPLAPLFRALTGLVVVALFEWRLAVGLIVLYGVTGALATRWGPVLERRFQHARERNSALTSRIQETLSGVQVIKAFGVEDVEQARFEQHSNDAFAAAYRARASLAVLEIVAFGLAAIPAVLAGAYLALLAADEAPIAAGAQLAFLGFAVWNLGAYVAAVSRTWDSSRSAEVLLGLWARTQDMAVGIDRAFDRVDRAPEVTDASDAGVLDGIAERVTVRGVDFGYDPGRPVLHDVHLEARVGAITALVGPSGAGKSTLAALLLRLFDPDAGVIEFDGRDVRTLTLQSVRARVGIALQEHLLFGATIRDNIAYAVPNATDAQIREAAQVALADEFIRRLPRGYDTPLGERGTRLSTGQRQRLSIARALIKDPALLILDEPTAALDAETEGRLMEHLARWGRQRVVLLITHRLSTLRQADEVAYLSGGRLVERGTHRDLTARPDGAYARFVASQTASRPDDGPGTAP